MPLVSVIVPAYNAADTVLETIQSVLQQSLQDLELIVVDDGSTDNTLAVVNTVRDSRLKLFSFENGGAAAARNRGIEQATGAFLSFIDADDLWVPDKLQKQLQALQQNPAAGGAYSWTLIMDAAGESFYPGNCESFAGDVYGQLLLSNFIGSGSNMLIRREAIEQTGGFDSSLRSHEDWDYYLRLSRHWPFAVVNEPQILYRKTDTSLCSNFEVMEEYIFVLHDKMFASVPPELMHLEQHSRAKKYDFLAQISLSHISNWQDCWRAVRTLRQAIVLHPAAIGTRRVQILIVKALMTLVLTPSLADRALSKLLSLRAKRYMASHVGILPNRAPGLKAHGATDSVNTVDTIEFRSATDSTQRV